jgi:hypothetical protein
MSGRAPVSYHAPEHLTKGGNNEENSDKEWNHPTSEETVWFDKDMI